MKAKSIITIAYLVAAIPSLLPAAIITATGNYEINQFGVSGDRQRSLAGAVGGSAGYVIQSFVLPNLGAIANPFTSASYSGPVAVFFNAGGNNSGMSLDLYALPVNGSPIAIAGQDTATGSLLQTSFVDSAIVTGTNLFNPVTNASADTALVSFLNTQYASGSGAGQTVFLRYSPSTVVGGFDGYDIYSSTGSNEGGPYAGAGPATITYSNIPEPGAYAVLAGLCMVGLCLLRRRNA